MFHRSDHEWEIGSMLSLAGAKLKAKQVARSLIPASILKDRYIAQRLGPSAGPIYMRLRYLDTLGMRRSNARRVPPEAKSLVFVCFGNIMRSAMAEVLIQRAILEQSRTGLRVASAGLHAVDGREAHPWALDAAREEGVS